MRTLARHIMTAAVFKKSHILELNLRSTSMGTAHRVIGEADRSRCPAQAIIPPAFIDDIFSVIICHVPSSLGGESDMFTIWSQNIGIAFMIIACIIAAKFWPWFHGGPASSGDEALFLFMFVLLFVYATIAHYPGTHLWGYVGLLWAATLQIIAGMFFACFDPPHHAHHVWIKQMKRMTSRLLRIFFAGTAAFPIPVTKLLSLEAFWKGSIFGIFACVTTKVFCAPFIGKARSVIGWAITAREANMATSQAAFVDEKVDLRSCCA